MSTAPFVDRRSCLAKLMTCDHWHRSLVLRVKCSFKSIALADDIIGHVHGHQTPSAGVFSHPRVRREAMDIVTLSRGSNMGSITGARYASPNPR